MITILHYSFNYSLTSQIFPALSILSYGGFISYSERFHYRFLTDYYYTLFETSATFFIKSLRIEDLFYIPSLCSTLTEGPL